MLLSIIIPAYDSAQLISRCLDSIVGQLSDDVEIIVVDDGSRDNTAVICKEYTRLHSRIKLIQQPNLGVSVARNRGIEAAAGKYLWFVDSDDFISEYSIAILLDFVKDNELDVLQFGYNIITDNGGCKTKKKSISEVLSFAQYLNGNYYEGTLWQSLIKKELITSRNRFKESLKIGQDGLFLMELMPKANRLQRISIVAYNYYQNTNSTTYNIPFSHCLLVSRLADKVDISPYFRVYQDNFIAFYSALSLFSDAYSEQEIRLFLDGVDDRIKKLFYVKVLQHLLTYNYGLLRIKKEKSTRIDSIKRIRSLIEKSFRTRSEGLILKAMTSLLIFTNIFLLDLFFQCSAFLLQTVFYFKNK